MAKKAEEKSKPIKPFLKWAGGKTRSLKHIIPLLPKDIKQRVYREPFLGAGSLFFAIQPEQAILSDANEHLIRCFEYVRDKPELIAKYLAQHKRKNREDYFYKIRDIYNKRGYSAAQAARFIYLNKACYNGIFRVNSKGEFNVPFGSNKKLGLPSREHLRTISKLLQKAVLKVQSFEKALEDAVSGDFVYLDPPYPPLNGTSYFTQYTKDKFNESDQKEVANVANRLNENSCLFMISNADIEFIEKLYKKFKIKPLSVTRCITCKKVRHKVKELIITNYEVE